MLHTIFFDLDNTLYPRDSGIWEAIGDRIDLYIKDKLHIDEIKIPAIRNYCRENHGTTLMGLKSLYDIDALDYLNFVHDVDLTTILVDDGQLKVLLDSLPQRKIIFTNSDKFHAKRVLNYFGVLGIFDEIIDVLTTIPYVKPQPEAFTKALSTVGLSSAEGCVFIDDMIENVEQGNEQGFLSILIGDPNEGFHSISDIFELPDLLKTLS